MKKDSFTSAYVRLLKEQVESGEQPTPEDSYGDSLETLIGEYGFKQYSMSAVCKYFDDIPNAFGVGIFVFLEDGQYKATMTINDADVPALEAVAGSPVAAFKSLVMKMKNIAAFFDRITLTELRV